jgi:hypothetical protein
MQSETQFAAMKSGKKHFSGGWVVVVVVVGFAFVVLQITQGSVLPSGNNSAPAVQQASISPNVLASTPSDAEVLINRCGRPDRDLDTGGFMPAPIIPSRMVTYAKAHLRIAYIAADPKGAPPPWHWKLMGLVDTRSNHAIDFSQMQSTLQQRLPCLFKRQP